MHGPRLCTVLHTRNFLNFMEPMVHRCSHKSHHLSLLWATSNPMFITVVTTATTCPSAEPHQSGPQFKIQCNIIFQSMTRSTKWSLSFALTIKTHYASLLLPIHATCPTHLLLLDLITQKISDDKYKTMKLFIMQFSPVSCYSPPLGPLSKLFSHTLSS